MDYGFVMTTRRIFLLDGRKMASSVFRGWYLGYVPSLSSRTKRWKWPLKWIKMVDFLIFFACGACRHRRRSISINFSKNLCKKINLFGTPPVRISWIRAWRWRYLYRRYPSCIDQIGQSKHYAKANKHLKSEYYANAFLGSERPNSSRAYSSRAYIIKPSVTVTRKSIL